MRDWGLGQSFPAMRIEEQLSLGNDLRDLQKIEQLLVYRLSHECHFQRLCRRALGVPIVDRALRYWRICEHSR